MTFLTRITTLFLLAGLVPAVFAVEAMSPAKAADYISIQNLVMKYAHVYDSRDVEGYVSIFAEDAKFTFGNTTLNGHKDIRNFITGVANSPAPTNISHHVITDTLIEFVSDIEAHHRSYWEIISGPPGGPFTVGGIGVYDDVVVKKNGQWLIQTRNIPQ
jgi:uncharacterized protein (TIGR02246 family)